MDCHSSLHKDINLRINILKAQQISTKNNNIIRTHKSSLTLTLLHASRKRNHRKLVFMQHLIMQTCPTQLQLQHFLVLAHSLRLMRSLLWPLSTVLSSPWLTLWLTFSAALAAY